MRDERVNKKRRNEHKSMANSALNELRVALLFTRAQSSSVWLEVADYNTKHSHA